MLNPILTLVLKVSVYLQSYLINIDDAIETLKNTKTSR